MELKLGYKQTEVGVIPEEWEAKPLGSVLSTGRLGGNYPNQDPEAEFPLMKMGNIARGYFDMSKVEYIKPGVTPENQHRLVRSDVLFNTRNTLDLVGKVAIWRDELPVAYYNSNLMRLEFDQQEVCSNEYANYALNTAGSVARLRALATGTTSVAAIYTRDLMGLQFVVPPPAEQCAIAEALSDVDASLGGLDRLIAKKRDLTQAAMQQLLTGQTRLPGFGGRDITVEKTAFGTFPSDWKPRKLSSLLERSRGIRYGIVQPGDYDPSGRYMIRGQDYSEVKGWARPSEVFRVSAAIEERYRNARVKAGDLIMTIVGYCGHVEQVPEWLDGANLTQTTARISIDSVKAVGAFCRYMLLGPVGRNQVAASLKGAAQPGLNCGDIEEFLLPMPSIPEQGAIATVLSDMDAELAALEHRRDKTRALKQAMMQELLTGSTRLVKPEAVHA